MCNGATVAAFEREFAAYVGAKYAIACANGTVTLQGALAANNVRRIVVPPLTMAATTIAALNVGVEVVFGDVDEKTWTLKPDLDSCNMPVSLYGLGVPWCGSADIDDAAQTMRPHSGAVFTSYSFQASKILSTGEGGMLVTDSEDLAAGARSYLSLGYRMRADQARIDPAEIKAPTYTRHHLTHSINGRMNDTTAMLGLMRLARVGEKLLDRREAADLYRNAIAGVEWLVPQFVPEGWQHDYWAYSVACDTPERAARLADAVVAHGGERPYGCWRLTYAEPAFKHLASPCPTAESLQPRLLQFQTNHLVDAERNARALRAAIGDVFLRPTASV